jgi:Copine/C2 domain
MQTLGGENREEIEIFISCTGLTKMDFLSKSDPRATIFLRNPKGQFDEVGKTEVIEGTLEPIFNTPIKTYFHFQSTQTMKILLEDDDGGNKFEQIGSAEFELSQIMAQKGLTMSFDLKCGKGKPAGKAILTISRAMRDRFSYTIDFKAKDIKDLEWFSQSDPFVRICKPKPQYMTELQPANIPDQEGWVKVHDTEYKKDNINPDFAEFTVPESKLCRGNENLPLKLEIIDFSKKGESEFKRIGKAFFTIKQLLGGLKEIQTFDDKKKPSGTIIVEKIVKSKTYDILDYINGGLNLSQIYMIDFTESNGNPKDPKSLHYSDLSTTNPYEEALKAITAVLFQYDLDRRIPMFGFGGSMPCVGIDESKDFFFLQTEQLIYASNIAEALKIYNSTFEYITLAGPCRLAPGIKSTVQWVRGVAKEDKLFYAVLVILCDGEVTDMDETIRMIVEAAIEPMSILLVGIGPKSFSDLMLLDSDGVKLKTKEGKYSIRDIVQFVDYKSIKGLGDLSEKLMTELPGQIVEYFRLMGIPPLTRS